MAFKLVLLLAVAVSASLADRPMIPEHLDFRSDEFIDYINNHLKTTWKAGRNFGPETSLDTIRAQLGAWKDVAAEALLPIRAAHPIVAGEIPEQFDSRENWPKCQTIRQVRDQGSCGSCWAFGAVEAMSDRICIASDQTLTDVEISSENLLACCSECGNGCRGGYPSMAWNYWVRTGIVTGGRTGTNRTCQPYSIPECEHHIEGPRPPCQGYMETPKCHRDQCTVASYKKSYHNDLHYGKSAYRVSQNVEQIQTELMTYGPVEVAFTVYADFVQYKSGVYQHHSGQAMGGHAVKMIGWGVENGTPYWLLTNSWNEDWGEKGFFKIRRGTNECGVESGIVAGLPRL